MSFPRRAWTRTTTPRTLFSDDIAWLGHVMVILEGESEVALQVLIRRVIDVSHVDCQDI